VNLIIDQGNTVTKVGLFDKDTLLRTNMFETFDVTTCVDFLSRNKVNKCIYSTVTNIIDEVYGHLCNKISDFLFFDKNISLPIKSIYQTPDTLGSDRLAAVAGANELFPENNILVIDAGTAITYDFIDNNGIFQGGNISPGIKQRFKALHTFTDKLPMVDRHGLLPDLGYNTDTSIRTGVVKGVLYEINSYINEYKLRYTNIQVFLTGGHCDLIKSQLKNNIFVEPNLVLKGLNRILNYNVSK